MVITSFAFHFYDSGCHVFLKQKLNFTLTSFNVLFFRVCSSYPKFHIVPAWTSDKDLAESARFRSMGRFPSIVWRLVFVLYWLFGLVLIITYIQMLCKVLSKISCPAFIVFICINILL